MEIRPVGGELSHADARTDIRAIFVVGIFCSLIQSPSLSANYAQVTFLERRKEFESECR